MIATLLSLLPRFTALDWQITQTLLGLAIAFGVVWLVRLRSQQRVVSTGLPSNPVSQLVARINRLPNHLLPIGRQWLNRIPILVIISVMMALAIGVQVTFDSDPAPSNPTSLWLIIAVIVVAGLLAFREQQDPALKLAEKPQTELDSTNDPVVSFAALKEQPSRTFLFTLSVVAVLFAAQRARDLEGNLQAGLSWLTGLSLFLAACWPANWRPRLSQWQEVCQKNRWDVILGLIVIGASAFIRFYRLDLPNIGREQDASNFGVDVLRYLNGEQLYLFGVKWFFNTPAVYGILQAAMFNIFGANDVGLGMLSAIQGSLNILFLFLLIRRMFGAGWGFIAGALLAVAQHHLYYSRTGENNLVVPLFMTMTLYFFHRGLYSRRSFEYAMAGISYGIGLWWDYNNKTVQMYPILGAILLYLFATQTRYWRTNWIRLGIFALGTILVLIPMWSAYAHTNALWFDFSHGRFVLSISNIDRAVQRYGTDSIFLTIWHQVEFTFFGINHIATGRAPNTIQMMDSVTSVFFFIGLAYSLWRWRDTRYGIFLVWFIVGLQGSIWSIDPPYAHRLVMALVPAFVFAAIGLTKIGQLWAHTLGWNRPFYSAAIAMLLLSTIWYTNIRYFFDPKIYPADWLHLKTVAEIINTNLPNHEVVFVGAPFVWTGHGEIEWYTQLDSLKAKDASSVAEIIPIVQQADQDVILIFIGNTYSVLDTTGYVYPSGVLTKWRDEVHDLDDILRTYTIPKEQVARPQQP